MEAFEETVRMTIDVMRQSVEDVYVLERLDLDGSTRFVLPILCPDEFVMNLDKLRLRDPTFFVSNRSNLERSTLYQPGVVS